MITTSHFSNDAHEYVKKIPQKIVLIGGRQLPDLMIDHNVGISPTSPAKTYTLKRLDRDYFDSP
jgi:restriction system protein